MLSHASFLSLLFPDKPWGEKCNALQQQLEHCKQVREGGGREGGEGAHS